MTMTKEVTKTECADEAHIDWADCSRSLYWIGDVERDEWEYGIASIESSD